MSWEIRFIVPNMKTTTGAGILVEIIMVLAAFVPSPVLGGRGLHGLHQTLPLEPGPVIGCPSPDGLRVGGWSTTDETSPEFQSAIQYVLGLLNLPHGESSFTVKYACTQVVSGTNFYMAIDLVDGGSVTATVHKPLPSSSTSNAAYQIMSLEYSEADPDESSKADGTPHDGSQDVVPGGCPGAPGLMGGWNPTDPMSTTIQGSVDYVLQSLNLPTSPDTYAIKIACTQVVAGTNVYLYVGSTNGAGYFSATVFNSLPNSNEMPYQINELFFVDDRVSNNVIVGSNSSGDVCPASGGPIGGWSEAGTTSNSVQGAVDYVLQALSLSTDPSTYNVTIACTQIVATGVNVYLSVDVTDGSHFSALVHQALQGTNAEPYEIMQLDFSSK